MWHKSSSSVSPKLVDKSSSHANVYVRKNVTLVPAHVDERGREVPDMYEYDEIIVPKKNWEIFEQVISQETVNSDMADALMELAGMIGG